MFVYVVNTDTINSNIRQFSCGTLVQWPIFGGQRAMYLGSGCLKYFDRFLIISTMGQFGEQVKSSVRAKIIEQQNFFFISQYELDGFFLTLSTLHSK